MTMSREPRVSLAQLLAEVDMLEKELKDLSREAQRGGDFVQQLEEIVARDVKHVKEIEKNTVRVNQEILELESRENFLTEAVNTGTKSAQLLVQMETQARSTLEGEREVTNQLKRELSGKLSTFAKQVEIEETKYRKIPEYMNILKMEERVRCKLDMVDKLEKEKAQVLGRRDLAAKEVVEDRHAWVGFKTSCLTLAEQWLRMNKMNKEVGTLRKEKGDVEMQVTSLLAEKNAGRVEETTNKYGQYQEELRNQTGLPFISPSEPESMQQKMTSLSSSSNVGFALPSIHPPPPKQKDPLLDINKNPQSTSTLPSIPLADSLDLNKNQSSTSLLPTIHPADGFKPPSTVSTYVPPTPRTKQLHLKLGTSLLSKRKAESVSAIAPPTNHGNAPSHVLRESLPGTPPGDENEKNSSEVSSVKVPVKKKSFKLGLPSLFGRKKPSSDIGGSKAKDEVMTRTPTLPHKEKDIEVDMVSKKVVENMDVYPDMVTKKVVENMDVDGEGVDKSTMPSISKCEMPLNAFPEKPAQSSVLSTHNTVEEVIPQDCPPSKDIMKKPKLPAVTKMFTPKTVPSLPIPTPRMNKTDVSPTPSPQERRQALCVSPGTALCDEKRKAVLEQLLESPQTVAKEIGNAKYNMEVGNMNDDMQQSVSDFEVSKGEGCAGFGLQGRASSTFDFEEKNEGSDFVMGGGGSKDMFGDMQNMENSFSFFGGGDCKEVDGQTKDDTFAFSFGGGVGEEGNGKQEDAGFAFSFDSGAGFEEQNETAGFSLF